MIRSLLRRLSAPAPTGPVAGGSVQSTPNGTAAAKLLARIGEPNGTAIESAAIASLLGETRSDHPRHTGHPDSVTCDAAELVAQLSCPDVRTDGLSAAAAGIVNGIANLVGVDGCPLASPAQVARSTWAAALAVQWAQHTDTPLDSTVHAALINIAHNLACIRGGMDWLPGQHGVPHFADDPAEVTATALGMAPSEPPNESTPDWRAWSWRASGATVAHGIIQSQPSRIWATSASSRFQWDWGQQTVLQAALSEPGTLVRARVDAPRFLAELATAKVRRTITARKARLVITDHLCSPVPLRWNLSEQWDVAPENDQFVATQDGACLIIKLDPSWTWSLDGSSIIGTGTTDKVTCRFEIR